MFKSESHKQECCNKIDSVAVELHELSQEIWSHPELNFKEHYAHGVLTQFLENHGFEVERQYKGMPTAFRARFRRGVGPHVALLCEYDALPLLGHACGHNLIAEVGAAAGVGVKAALESSLVSINGQITVLGTPAEEGGGGKIDLIKAGAFTEVDVALMAHPSNFTHTRPLALSMNAMTVKYHGKASHASSSPWDGVNALDAAVLAYQSVSVLRQQLKPNWKVHGIIVNGGIMPNIIPELSELRYMFRCPTIVEVRQLHDKLLGCFEAAARATGCTVEYVYDQKPYEELVSNETLAKLFEDNSETLGINVCHDEAVTKKYGGSTDMGNVSHVVPSLQPKFYIGSNSTIHTRVFQEAAGSTDAQRYTLAVGKALAMVTLDILTNAQLLPQIKAEFQKDLSTNQ